VETKSAELEKAFPRLAQEGYSVTSNPDKSYNCIAWAAGVNNDWWDTAAGYTWPDGADREATVPALIAAYSQIGYEICQGGALEEGFDKIAVYGADGLWTHASRQLQSGKWTSKLGRHKDIEHTTPEAVADSEYGKIVCFMRRLQK